MILVDTSAWVEYDRATGSPVDVRLTNLIADDGPLAVTEPVVMEMLAGARTDQREAELRRLLLRFDLLRFDPVADFHGAARIYRMCRREGVTPRGLVDCMIASVALRNSAVLLAHDADMHRVAKVVGLEMDAASLHSDIQMLSFIRTASGPSGHRDDGMSDAAPADPRRYRIEVRVSADQDALIRQVADLEGATITAFVMDTTIARARRVLRQHQDLMLSNEGFDRFIAELDRPTEPVAELAELFRSNPTLPGD